MKLFNTETNQVEDIEEDIAYDALSSGKYGFASGEKYTFDTPEGIKELDANQAAENVFNPEYSIVPKDLARPIESYKEDAWQSDLAVLEGGARSFVGETLGRQLSKMYNSTPEDYVKRSETPEATWGEGIGAVLGLAVPGPNFVKGVDKIAGKVGQTVAKGLKGPITKTATKLGIQGGIEASLYQAEKAISDTIHDGKDLITTDNAAKIMKSGLAGAGFGSVLGATGGAGYKAIKSVSKATSNMIKNFIKRTEHLDAEDLVKPDIENLRFDKDFLDPSIGSTSAKFKIVDDNILRYDDGLNVVDVDAKTVLSQIPDIDDVKSINMIGESLTTPDSIDPPVTGLGYVMKSIQNNPKITETKWQKAITDTYPFYTRKPDERLLEDMVRFKLKSKGDDLFLDDAVKVEAKRINDIFDKRDLLLAEMTKDGFSLNEDFRTKIRQVNKEIINFKTSLRTTKGANKKDYIQKYLETSTPDSLKNASKKLNESMRGYKVGNEVYVFDKNLINEALEDSWLKIKKKDAGFDLPAGTTGVINFVGGKAKTYAKKPELLLRMRQYILDNIGPRKWLPDEDLLYNNVLKDRAKAIQMKDAALNQVQNEMELMQEPTNFNGKNIADWVQNNWIKKYIRPETGEVLPKDQGFVNSLKAFRDKYLAQPADTTGVSPVYIDPSKQQDWSVRLINDTRMKVDDEINWLPKMPDNVTPTKESQKFLKSYRNFLDNTVLSYVDNHPKGDAIRAQYKAANELYQTTEEIYKLLSAKNLKEMGKHNFTGADMMTTAAISAGGGLASFAISGSPIVGFLVGGALSKGSRLALGKYGDYWGALLTEKLAKSSFDFDKTIMKSVGKFMDKRIASPVLAVGSSVISGNIYEEYKKEENRLNKLEENLESYMKKYEEDNALLKDKQPEIYAYTLQKTGQTYEFLKSNFPKPPEQALGMDWKPSKDLIYRYFRIKNAITNPKEMVKNIERGYLTSEEIDVLRSVYPELLSKMKAEFYRNLKGKTLSYSQRALAARVFDYNGDKLTQQMKISGEQAATMPAPDKSRQSSGNFSGQEPTESIRIENK